ncbi:MAG: hypothetical protein MJZ11_08750 [Lachnospiraceae bacterium]|nr:hypothetical protein [Lachnospiraceae bacterium]
MPKHNRDYDTVFKTLKSSHKRLFVSIINKIFNKQYPLNTIPTVLSTDNYIENSVSDEIEERDSDLFMEICGDTYLIECQSYEDGTMAIRIAEYAFLTARNTAVWENGKVVLNMPQYAVIYVKSNNNTPQYTEITFKFPNHESITYNSKNIILKEYKKEDIIKDRLIPYIPFYMTRYEKEMLSGDTNDISVALSDLEYFKDALIELYKNKELSADEIFDIMGYINRIIKHITNGNDNEERLVSIMGGKIEETPSQELKRTELEKTALSLFANGVSFDIVRKSISMDLVDNNRLLEIQKIAFASV